ncbi:amidohydrolase [Candidatus Bathyarchaeota archaeon]|nr:MAG: amidohydrolase [Candidatus Bathyarchaeota archaeon]
MNIDLLLKGCTVLQVDPPRIIPKGAIAVDNGVIIDVCSVGKAPKFRAEETIDADGLVAIPGLVNCHTHVPMSIFRGTAEDQQLEEWLTKSIWPLEARLTRSDVYYGALLGCLEMIKNGVTCFCDMYFYEDAVVKAVEDAGLRAVLAPGIIEAGDRERGEKMLDEAVRTFKRFNGSAKGRIRIWLGPHAVYTCSQDLLGRVREEASSLGTGIHIHLAESKETVKLVKEMYGKSETFLLRDLKFLGSDVLVAHGIYLNLREIRCLAKYGVKVSYNPVSNMKLASGVPRVHELLENGVTVGLGTDGPASNNSLDMFDTMKMGALLQKVYYRDPTVLPVRKCVEMATVEGAKALGLEEYIGSLRPGKKADIILLNFKTPNLNPIHNLYANLVYSCRGCDVDTVIVDGKILMRNRKVLVLDENLVIKSAVKIAERIVSSSSR